jgi:hypothetical protein
MHSWSNLLFPVILRCVERYFLWKYWIVASWPRQLLRKGEALTLQLDSQCKWTYALKWNFDDQWLYIIQLFFMLSRLIVRLELVACKTCFPGGGLVRHTIHWLRQWAVYHPAHAVDCDILTGCTRSASGQACCLPSGGLCTDIQTRWASDVSSRVERTKWATVCFEKWKSLVNTIRHKLQLKSKIFKSANEKPELIAS